MGQDKALLRRDGKTQLAHVFGILDALLPRVFVSNRRDQSLEAERAQFAQILDRYENLGPVAGILSAMDEYPEVDWLVVACDLPNIGSTTITHLLDNCDKERLFTAYESSHDGLPEPLCAIYRSESSQTIADNIAAGTVCPRKILIRSDARLLRQPDPSALDNVNTPDDLAGTALEAS